MVVRLLDLHADELAMLDRLDDGRPTEDGIGVAADRLSVPELRS